MKTITFFIFILALATPTLAQDSTDCLNPSALICQLIDPIILDGDGSEIVDGLSVPRGLYRIEYAVVPSVSGLRVELIGSEMDIVIDLGQSNTISGTTFKKIESDEVFSGSVSVDGEAYWELKIEQIDPYGLSHDFVLRDRVENMNTLGPFYLDEGTYGLGFSFLHNDTDEMGYLRVTWIRIDGEEQIAIQTMGSVNDLASLLTVNLEGGFYCINITVGNVVMWNASLSRVTPGEHLI